VPFWWGIASSVAMALGAVGPWAHILTLSIGGLDGSNDGGIVIGLAVLGLLCVLGSSNPSLALLAVVAGVAGAAVTASARHHVTSMIADAGPFGALASVGWGLNLALAGSVSLALAGLVLATTGRAAPARPARAAGVPEIRATGVLPADLQSGPRDVAPVPARAAAGWYVDPDDQQRLRYWTGESWGEQTAQAGPQ
jgi:hypothetical protein